LRAQYDPRDDGSSDGAILRGPACREQPRPWAHAVTAPVEDCLFCSIVSAGAYVNSTKGFVAIKDINPQAPVHLLVIPERHVDTFRDVAAFGAKEAKRMLDFVAETAEGAGLAEYRVLVNVGRGAGQTVFHLHWHVLGGDLSPEEVPAAVATAEASTP
jgi:histidine triad (HIT) family protein